MSKVFELKSEGDVYRLIAHSKLLRAERFESWMFDEVLSYIRKSGAYMTDDVLEQAFTSPVFYCTRHQIENGKGKERTAHHFQLENAVV